MIRVEAALLFHQRKKRAPVPMIGYGNSVMFIEEKDILVDPVPMGRNEFFSHPTEDQGAPATDVILVRGVIEPGMGHGFHYHEDREEFLYILEGEIEQWIEKEKRILHAGDVIYLPPGMVHGSFNVGSGQAKVLAAFGNKSSECDLSTDVSEEEPWASIRS